jgi:hypothetical protein
LRRAFSKMGNLKIRRLTSPAVKWLSAFAFGLAILPLIIFLLLPHQNAAGVHPATPAKMETAAIGPESSLNSIFEFDLSTVSASWPPEGGRYTPVLPFSVIPGGVQSGDDLRVALQNDLLAAKHYAIFNVSSSHVVRLARDRRAYVSYRLGDRMYWTSHQGTLHAGEALLTDGVHLARMRCGNRISDPPETPTHPSEPAESLLNSPIAPILPEMVIEPLGGDPSFRDGPLALALLTASRMDPPLSPSPSPTPGFILPYAPISCCANPKGSTGASSAPPSAPSAPIIPPPQPAPVSTPEPATGVLLATALVSFCIFLRKCLRAT